MNCTLADRSVSLGRGTTLPHPGSRSHLWRRHHAQNSRYGIRDKPIAPASPWQNGFAERLIGSIRRECVDHIVVWGEGHLCRILCAYARFSNRPFGVKHFQTIHQCSVDVAHGLALLFGLGTKALPVWDSRTRRNNLLRGLTVRLTIGPSGHANSPHPSSREGHLSTAGWSSGFLLLHLILRGFHAAA